MQRAKDKTGIKAWMPIPNSINKKSKHKYWIWDLVQRAEDKTGIKTWMPILKLINKKSKHKSLRKKITKTMRHLSPNRTFFFFNKKNPFY